MDKKTKGKQERKCYIVLQLCERDTVRLAVTFAIAIPDLKQLPLRV
jgi:hypothetical protein